MSKSFPNRNASNRGKKFPPEPLTIDEIKFLLRACSSRSATGLRNRALLVALYRGGLRISEALGVWPKDLDIGSNAVRVLRGKGRTSRLIGLDNGALSIIQLWMQRRTLLGLDSRSPLFCTLKGEPLKAAYVRALLPRLAKKAGIQRRCHAHGLRHAFAFELANEGTPLHVIQATLGHKSLQTTQAYVSHLNPTQVISAMKSREWSL